MSVPKKRRSRSKARRAKTHKKISSQKLDTCTHCSTAIITHRACSQCGQYKGRTVLNTEKRAKRLEKKQKQSR